MMRVMRKGQSITEYAIVVLLVIAAVAAMQVYVKRRHQAMVKLVADTAVGGLLDAGVGFNKDGTQQLVAPLAQYDPYYNHSNMTSTTTAGSTDNLTFTAGGKVQHSGTITDTRSGDQGAYGSGGLANDDNWK